MCDSRTQEDIMVGWQGDPEKPWLSIVCVAYNHEPFIEDAIQGFLIQNTRFPFEIILHDDASTDATAAIIREYAARYPRIIRAMLQTENQFSRNIKPVSLILPQCRGRYIAFCEGDDYWTDPEKLQRQVDFLERNPDYVISGHDAVVIDEAGNRIKDGLLPDEHKRDYDMDELATGKAWILTLSRVYRNVIKEWAPERNQVEYGDKFLASILGCHGKSHYHPDIKPAVYRVHDGGVWSGADPDQRVDENINTSFWIYRYYKRIGRNDHAAVYRDEFVDNAFRLARTSRLVKELICRMLFLKAIMRRVKKILGEKQVSRLKIWLRALC